MRDKIAASRRKGKRLGGQPILRYNVEHTKLIVDEGEAEQVRQIFELYLEHQAMLPVVQELNRRGWATKHWVTQKGVSRGARPFTKNALHKILTNIVYIGKVRHKEDVYEVEHVAIPWWQGTEPRFPTAFSCLASPQSNPSGNWGTIQAITGEIKSAEGARRGSPWRVAG